MYTWAWCTGWTGRSAYLCVVTGDVPNEFTLTDYLIHDEIKNREVVCEADEKGGKMAILHGRCIDRRNGTALCAIRLETGRKHQIRAQLSNIGAPLWGDNRYGTGIPGQQIALWGYKLTFRHPTQNELMTFHSLPEGGIWDTYADLLTIPEDVDMPRERPALVLREEVVLCLDETFFPQVSLPTVRGIQEKYFLCCSDSECIFIHKIIIDKKTW